LFEENLFHCFGGGERDNGGWRDGALETFWINDKTRHGKTRKLPRQKISVQAPSVSEVLFSFSLSHSSTPSFSDLHRNTACPNPQSTTCAATPSPTTCAARTASAPSSSDVPAGAACCNAARSVWSAANGSRARCVGVRFARIRGLMLRGFARVVPRGWGRRKRRGWQGGVSAGLRGRGRGMWWVELFV